MDRRLLPRRNNCSFHQDPAGSRPYAVLLHVSMGYSPPKGRSPTCYSPVRHSHVGPKPHNPVRLACLIRAASVRSEPGSNSPLYLVSSPFRRTKSLISRFVLTRFKQFSYLSSIPFPILEKLPSPEQCIAPPETTPSLFSKILLALRPFKPEAQERIYCTQSTNVKYLSNIILRFLEKSLKDQ
jgi:hypothetical protein